MSERINFLMSFRARLMLLLTAFLLLTVVLVVALNNVLQKQTNVEIEKQSQQVKDAVNDGFADLAQALSIAVGNLGSDKFLYERFTPEQLPKTIETIIVTDDHGEVKDATLPELIDGRISVPPIQPMPRGEVGDPVEQEVVITPGDAPMRTYNTPVETAKGWFWIVVVQRQDGIINQINSAQETLAATMHRIADYRIAATIGLLGLALIITAIVGWRFTRPINELAGAARRVAAGDVDFRVSATRPDEVGQLARTFNEMLDGLKAKRELEEKLNQAERAAVVGRLTQAVAHEIRNPLNVINLSIDHVSSKFAPEDDTRRRQFTRILTSIKDEIQRLNRLVSDLLHYGRPAKLAIQNVDMRELLGETLALVRPQADELNVDIAVDDDMAPVHVQGDAEKLKSCLSNIAINALQSMPRGGRLSASVERENGFVEVTIADTGVGIPEEALAKIFEPYFSTKQTGFGLGLAVTKKIVEEHHGSIEVASQVDRGTTFKIRLPAAD